MIVAAHQPSFLPWLGYLDKLAQADLFVVMDDLQFEAQNFQNRNRIKVNNGIAWLTVPLVRGSQRDLICDKIIRNDGFSAKEHWQRRTRITLETHYGRAPYFSHYADELEEVWSRPWERLVDLDLHILKLVMRWLGLSRPILLSSSLGLAGQKTARILDLCRRVGARAYLSGKGGSTGYLDVAALERAGVEVAWQQFEHPVYQQRYPALGFVPNLCVLDLLFNCGPGSRDILFAARPLALPVPVTMTGGV
jgi:hypothetical protein